MVATAVFNSAYKVRIGDNATPTAGTYEVYLNPLVVSMNITPIPMPGTEIVADADMSYVVYAGGIDVIVTLGQMEIPYTSANRENFEKAIVYWTKNNSLLYITAKIDATDWLTFPAYSDQAMAAFVGRLKRIQQMQVTTELITISTVEIRRYTYVPA